MSEYSSTDVSSSLDDAASDDDLGLYPIRSMAEENGGIHRLCYLVNRACSCAQSKGAPEQERDDIAPADEDGEERPRRQKRRARSGERAESSTRRSKPSTSRRKQGQNQVLPCPTRSFRCLVRTRTPAVYEMTIPMHMC
jgi:hypothetical protein